MIHITKASMVLRADTINADLENCEDLGLILKFLLWEAGFECGYLSTKRMRLCRDVNLPSR